MNDKRTPVIAGNWKMNLGPSDARAFCIELRARLGDLRGRRVILFPPFVSLPVVADELERTSIEFGGQNLYWEGKGAFTGETSPLFLRELGCSTVLVGHSERRHVFGEKDQECGRKVRAALDAGLVPVLCCGEKLEDREAGDTFQVVRLQLKYGLGKVKAEEAFLVAYEPVWAIGTGRTATPEQAQEVHALIRAWLGEKFGDEAKERIPVLYGGSVKPENVDELMARPDIDGVLVGGASLKVDSFERLVRFQA